MVTTKRTQKEIEKDCKRIKEAAKTAKSIRDIEKATNLSYSEIKTTLSKHPIIFKRIKEQLAVNKEQAEVERKKQKQRESLDKVKEKNISKKEETKVLEVVKNENIATKDVIEGYVIDASITGVEYLRKNLYKLCAKKSKIILTSITIKELEKMQGFYDVSGCEARYILALAAENPNIFETVLIDETLDTPDDCIINYCVKNKEMVTLLTSDKTMVLKARMYDVQVKYLKKNKYNSINTDVSLSNPKIETLYSAKKLQIS